MLKNNIIKILKELELNRDIAFTSTTPIDEIADYIAKNINLTPKVINNALKDFDNDGDRLIAMENICRCGAVTKRDSICWSCYNSPAENYN